MSPKHFYKSDLGQVAKPPLPDDWSCRVSSSFPGHVYYFNHKTGDTTWKLDDLLPATVSTFNEGLQHEGSCWSSQVLASLGVEELSALLAVQTNKLDDLKERSLGIPLLSPQPLPEQGEGSSQYVPDIEIPIPDFQTVPNSSEIYKKKMTPVSARKKKKVSFALAESQDANGDVAAVQATGYVASKDTPEESYESIFALAANRFSRAKPSIKEGTGEVGVDNRRKILRHVPTASSTCFNKHLMAKYRFNAKCPTPDPRWGANQQLMIGPIPGKTEYGTLRSAFLTKGHIVHFFIRNNEAWLEKKQEKIGKKQEKIGKKQVKFGYVVYTEPEVAKQLLNDGQVLVGDMLVSVKEMEGQSSGKSISSPQVHNMLPFPPSAESVPHPPSPVQADMPEGGAAEKEGKCVADRDQRVFKSWSRKCVFDMKQFVRQEEGGQYSCILCDKIFSMRSNCNKHVTLTHLNMCWVCRSCGVKRKSKQAVNAHIMKSHGVSSDVGFDVLYNSV